MDIQKLIYYLNNKSSAENLFQDINIKEYSGIKKKGSAYSFFPYNSNYSYLFTEENFNKLKTEYSEKKIDKEQYFYLLNIIDLLIEVSWSCNEKLKSLIEQTILDEDIL